MSDSPHAHEREALDVLRSLLPDRAPYRVWSNFDFTTPSGLLREVDALVASPKGLFLVEIKSHPGRMGGDGSTWQWTTPRGRVRVFDNPRLLANRKAKELKEVLSRTKTFSPRRGDVPYVTELVFLSAPGLEVTLSPPGRYNVCGREAADGGSPRLQSVRDVLVSPEPGAEGRRPRRRIDAPLGERLVKAVDQAGIRERTSRRRINDYRIVELLDTPESDRETGLVSQDYLVEHAHSRVRRRLRIYPREQNLTVEQEQASSRAARHEFEHLHRIHHPGIVSPADYIEHERGPCLLFDLGDAEEEPLDRWMAMPGRQERLAVDTRLDILRDVTEAMAHAHRSRIYHRALCPSAVMVTSRRDAPDVPRSVRVASWQAGLRTMSSEAASRSRTGTDHLDALATGDTALYRAPEHLQPLADPAGLDVFSVGCLAGFLFTGQPPAATPTRLREMLADVGHVDVAASGDNVDAQVGELVALCTGADPEYRLADMDKVLASLDEVEEAWTAPEVPDEPEELHVAAVRRGSTLCGGRFDVRGRLGRGSTAFALLMRDRDDGDQARVLKVALSPAENPRIEAEAAALDGLRDPSIVRLYGNGPLEIDGHAALLLSYAGDRADAAGDRRGAPGGEAGDGGETGEVPARTLASRIGEPLGAELLERFGDDLLGAVKHLEQMGVPHRDIKPDNLGVGPRGKNDELHLVLFDFSLANVPIAQVDAGTPGYIDPWVRHRGQWDLAAERYAAAVVLYELSTGTRPMYGDGRADPALVDAPLSMESHRDLLEPDVADGLVAFFRAALAPDTGDRFGTAEDMQRAWQRAFEPAHRPASGHVPSSGGPRAPEAFAAPPGTTRATPLAGLALSSRAVNALERHDVLTVGDLLATQLNQLRVLPGVGAKTRGELVAAVAHLREALAASGDAGEDAPLVEVAAWLVPKERRADEVTRSAVLRRYLGLEPGGDGSDGETPHGAAADRHGWPSPAALADAAGVTRARVSQVLTTARRRWAKQPPVTTVRTWVADEVAEAGGVAALDQLVDRLVASRPSQGDAAEDRAAGTAMLVAALSVEADMTSPRWVHRILATGAVAVACGLPDGTDANGLADEAAGLARRTAELLDERQIVPRVDLVAALRAGDAAGAAAVDRGAGVRGGSGDGDGGPDVGTPAGPLTARLRDAQVIELAVALCPAAALNTRLELYPRGLPARVALAASRRAFVVTTEITPEEVARKVRARFPAAAPLPDRPELDALIAEAGLELAFDPSRGAYRPPDLPSAVSNGLSLPSPAPSTVGRAPVEVDPAGDFEERLRASTGHGGLLVLMTGARQLEDAARELARLPVTVVDVDDWLIAEIERLTETGRPTWDLVVAADAAGPGSLPWQRLANLVDAALEALTGRLAATPGAVLLVRCGLLARYDRLDVVATWRDVLHRGEGPLRALWMLVATPEVSEVPLLDGRPIQVVSANEWARIPNRWLARAAA